MESELQALAEEARKYKSAEEFVKAQIPPSKWEKLHETNPELWDTGILRSDRIFDRLPPGQGVVGKDAFPEGIRDAQIKWQNYGQYDEIEAEKIYERPGPGYKDSGGTLDGRHTYLDRNGKEVLDSNGYVLEDKWGKNDEDEDEIIKALIPTQRLKDDLLEAFSTEKGKEHLNKIIDALPKNPDGSITAYRIGVIGEGPQSFTLSEGMAKTFSHQGTDIMPPGMPGLPKHGYKDFGLIPANITKIDPKGIVAYSPYDSEILVDSKYIKTKDQLTEIYNQSKDMKEFNRTVIMSKETK